jgi:hypothetical protein
MLRELHWETKLADGMLYGLRLFLSSARAENLLPIIVEQATPLQTNDVAAHIFADMQ